MVRCDASQRVIRVSAGLGFAAFRAAARPLLERSVPPPQVLWQAESGQLALFGSAVSVDVAVPPALQRPGSLAIPAAYARLAENAAYHRDESRLDAMYRVAYRIAHGEPALLQLVTDPDVLRLTTLSQQVARDLHKTHAFVRFRKTDTPQGEHYVAWHRPDHPLLKLAAPFFRDRFPNMRWTILTPDASFHAPAKSAPAAPGSTPKLLALAPPSSSAWAAQPLKVSAGLAST